MKSTKIILFLGALMLVQCMTKSKDSALRESFNLVNSPFLFAVFPSSFDLLPREGMMPDESYPWTDDYWGIYAGGIARRWQKKVESKDYRAHQYPLMTEEQVKAAPLEELNSLSPAEKYDIYLARYDFPLTNAEWNTTLANRQGPENLIPTWFGICHGWAAAAIGEPEADRPVQVTNPDGVKLTFFSSDLKALMSAIYADAAPNDVFATAVMGTRCELPDHGLTVDATGRIVQAECRDVNPGALHLVLADHLGNPNAAQRKSFVIDVTRSDQVWNQPVAGFQVKEATELPMGNSDSQAAFRAPGTQHLVRVKTDLFYVAEMEPSRLPRRSFKDTYTKKLSLDYTLELDKERVVIGGEWNTLERPDFMWRMIKDVSSGDKYLSYQTVRKLVDQSLGQPTGSGSR